MTQEGGNPWIMFGVAIAMFAAVAALYYKTLSFSNTENKWYYHLIYWVIAGATFGIPTNIACYMFDNLSVTLIATLFPMYEALRAICTPDEDDDKYWLLYFIIGGFAKMCTQFVDEWMESEEGKTYWFQGMFFFFFWLYFPKTVGAALIYENFTEPYLAPIVAPLTSKVHGLFSFVYHASINACHIALLVLFFILFPRSLKKVIAVAVGTAYPLLASITAATTDTADDDSYWLTYWTCYMALFLLMELLETWLGWIPGFYAFYIATTLYLMLPMFNGADKVFRKVLVPLARLQDMLLLRDAVQIKKRILAELDEEQGKAVKRAIVEYYDDDNKNATIDERALENRQAGFSWKNIPLLGQWLGGGEESKTDTEKEDVKETKQVDATEGAGDNGEEGAKKQDIGAEDSVQVEDSSTAEQATDAAAEQTAEAAVNIGTQDIAEEAADGK